MKLLSLHAGRWLRAFPRRPLPLCLEKAETFGPFDQLALRKLIHCAARRGCRMLEVGSWLGTGSTQVFIEEMKIYEGELYCVDSWEGSANAEGHAEFVARYDLFDSFLYNVYSSPAPDLVTPVRMSSLAAAAELAGMQFDLVFLDGDHSYSATSKDIAAWLPLVRPGGFLCGHDCEARVRPETRKMYEDAREQDCIDSPEIRFVVHHPGVILAVDEAFGGRVHLWSDELLELPDGRKAPGTIWDVRVW